MSDPSESDAGPRDERDLLDRLADPLRHAGRVDYRNLGMATRTAAVLGKPSPRNWLYNRAFLAELPVGLYRALFDPNAMNDFQRVRAEAGAVSTPADGLLAGVTERGRVSALFAPHTGFTNQVPYHVHDDADLLKGAKPREGAFFGARIDGDPEWFWEDAYDHAVRPLDDCGVLEVTATRAADRGPALEITERISVVPGTDVLARDLTVHNAGDTPVDSLIYYAQVNANAELQYPPGTTSPNRATAADELRWTDRESDTAVRAFPDAGTGVLASGVASTPLDRLFDRADATATGHYLGGYLDLDAPVAPGETATVTVFRTARDDAAADDAALALDPDERLAATRKWWAEALADLDLEGVPERHRANARRSVVDLLTLYDPDSGSISAAPHVQPAYYPSWPRDGAFTAVALARLGLTDPAVDFLGRFLPRVQETDGSFEQCYASNGEPAGVIPVENDQQPTVAWAVRETYEALHRDDEAAAESFLADAWPTVRDALDYTLDAMADNDLLAATHDYAEMWTDADQSLWTNTLAYRGLRDGAALADAVGDRRAGVRFASGAAQVGDAVDREFFDVDAPVGGLSSGAEPADDWSPVGRFATNLTVTGPEQRPTTIAAVAVFPTGWAAAYSRREELLDALDAMYAASPTRWLPKEFLYAAALYRAGDREDGDRVVDELGDERLPGGALAEEVTPEGDHAFAALGWSAATYLLALDERRRADC